MALFNFTCTVPNEGTTFVLGSWICIANSLGGFNSHLADFKRPEASAATQRDDLDEFIDNVDEVPLPYLAREIVRGSVFNATSTHAAPSFLSSDPIHSVSGEQCTRPPFGLCNAVASYQAAMHSTSLSMLEDHLDRLLKIRKQEATASWRLPYSTTTQIRMTTPNCFRVVI